MPEEKQKKYYRTGENALSLDYGHITAKTKAKKPTFPYLKRRLFHPAEPAAQLNGH